MVFFLIILYNNVRKEVFMKELKVDINMCIGCGSCAAIDSEHFTINDAGLSEATSQENLESPAVNEAIDACPVRAITL